jgi:hypothetical protein
MPVAEFGLHDSNCLNRRIDAALFLPGKVQHAEFPCDVVVVFVSACAVSSSVVSWLGNMTRDPRRGT